MKHIQNLCKAFIGLYLCFALISNAAAPAPIQASSITKDDLSAQKELLQMQIDSKKELLQKDIDVQNKRIDAFDKRLDDQLNYVGNIGWQVDRFGIIAALVSILVALFVAAIGFMGYKAARSDARQVAQEAAVDASQKWFEENNEKLNARLEELESKARDAIKNIDTHTQTVRESSDLAKAEIQSLQERMEQDMLGQRSVLQQTISSSPIEQRAQELRTRSEDSYSFDDWNTRAFAAFKEGKLEDAAFYWGKAVGAPAARAINSAQAMFNKGLMLGQLNRSEEEIAIYDELIEKFSDASDANLCEQVAKAMVNKGVRLGRITRGEEAIVIYDSVIKKFGDAPEINLREQVTRAMIGKAITLGKISRNEEAISIYDALIEKFGDAPEINLRGQVARAMVNKGVRLGQLNRSEEEAFIYDAVIKKFGDSPEIILREQVAIAMINKAIRLGQLNRSEEEAFIYDEVIKKFSDAPEINLREQVAKAMINKAITLGQLNRKEEEIAIYDSLIEKFDYAPEVNLLEQVARAMISKAVTLGQLNRNEEEIAIYDAVIKKFDRAAETKLNDQVAAALNGKGFSLLCQTKATWAQPEKAKNVLEQAKQLFKQAMDKAPNNGVVHGNLAYIAWLQNDQVTAEQHFRDGLLAEKEGGGMLYEGTLSDFEIHPIEPDNGFKKLVEKLWLEYQQNQNS